MVSISADFHLSKSPEIVFGTGTAVQLGKYCRSRGGKVLLVTGGKSYENYRIRNTIEVSLQAAGMIRARYPVSGEPSPNTVDEGTELARSQECDLIVAVGGGSVLDAGKAIAAMCCEEGSVLEYLEGVGDKQASGVRLPLIAVPTTAGTGSEATKNAVISEQGSRGFKKSLRHDNYVPDIALVDPELTLGCSKEQTAASGMDAFTQLLESYLSIKSNDLTDALAYGGLKAVSQSLEKLMKELENHTLRSKMSYSALLSGITLANAGLGVIHGFAQPLGCYFPVAHGIVCGTLMGPANRITVQRLRECGDPEGFLAKYATIGKLFAEQEGLKDEDYTEILLDTIDRYTHEFGIPRLSDFGIGEKDIQKIVEATGLKNHPVELGADDLAGILGDRI